MMCVRNTGAPDRGTTSLSIGANIKIFVYYQGALPPETPNIAPQNIKTLGFKEEIVVLPAFPSRGDANNGFGPIP